MHDLHPTPSHGRRCPAYSLSVSHSHPPTCHVPIQTHKAHLAPQRAAQPAARYKAASKATFNCFPTSHTSPLCRLHACMNATCSNACGTSAGPLRTTRRHLKRPDTLAGCSAAALPQQRKCGAHLIACVFELLDHSTKQHGRMPGQRSRLRTVPLAPPAAHNIHSQQTGAQC